jgi:hypothetical protein
MPTKYVLIAFGLAKGIGAVAGRRGEGDPTTPTTFG